jgi:hypothetical protein
LPILIDMRGRVVAGWGLVLAARQMGLREVPAVRLTDLSEAELRTLRLALNRITDDSAWEGEELALEFSEILELAPQIDLEVSGFEMGEIDFFLDGRGLDQEDELVEVDAGAAPVSRPGDLWLLGEHRILCGDALVAASYQQVLGAESADMVFTDPPYNVAIPGHVSELGAVKHKNFAMASGELSSAEFLAFLRTSLGHAAHCSNQQNLLSPSFRSMRRSTTRSTLTALDQPSDASTVSNRGPSILERCDSFGSINQDAR